MTLLYALNYTCDVLFYFGALGCWGLLGGMARSVVLFPAALFGACAGLQRLREHPRAWVRWLPMAAALAGLVWMRTLGQRLMGLIPAVYLVFYVRANRAVADYYYVALKFRAQMIALIYLAVFAAVGQSPLWTQGLVYLFLYFALMIFLLRMLRQDDRTARSAKFRLMNLGSLALVGAAGYALSLPPVIAALRSALGLVARVILLPIASAVAYVLELALYALSLLIGRIMPNVPLEGVPEPQMQMADSMEQLLDAQAERPLSPVVRWILIGLGAALAVAAALLLLRLIARQTARMAAAGEDEERESLPEVKPLRESGALRRRRDPEAGVRHHYRRALRHISGHGGRVTPFMNPTQIEQANAGAFSPDGLRRLREVYAPVRYGERPPTPQDVKRAEAAAREVMRSRERAEK